MINDVHKNHRYFLSFINSFASNKFSERPSIVSALYSVYVNVSEIKIMEVFGYSATYFNEMK